MGPQGRGQWEPQVLASLEGVSLVGDTNDGNLIRLFLRCDLDMTLLARPPWFLPLSESAFSAFDSVIHLIVFW